LFDSRPEQVLDEYLVILAQGGSGIALVRLVNRWTPRLRRFATRTLGRAESAQDVVQDTWLAAIRGLRGLNDAASFPGWIYGIARRKSIDALRAEQRRRRLSSRIETDPGATTTEEINLEAGQALDLEAALKHLPREQREVVILFYGEDLGVAEIATALSVPAGTVKSRLFHARQLLRKLVGE
jgi:RNA polymerase sigma factor (sigma-70 family)